MQRTYYYSDKIGKDYDGEEETRTPVSNPQQANLVGSKLADGSGLHVVTVDIDLPARLIESETPGHYHLFIDQPMTWDDYSTWLDVSSEIGLIERGYYNAAMKRGETFLATKPWKRSMSVGLAPNGA